MDKNITFLNQAALTILGKTRKEVIGKYCGNV
jgi:PAS domain-containing protein